VKETTTQAPTMIGRLQDLTKDQQDTMNSARSKQYKNKLESKQLLARVLAIIQRYDLDP
jgi:hypothetical protein